MKGKQGNRARFLIAKNSLAAVSRDYKVRQIPLCLGQKTKLTFYRKRVSRSSRLPSRDINARVAVGLSIFYGRCKYAAL